MCTGAPRSQDLGLWPNPVFFESEFPPPDRGGERFMSTYAPEPFRARIRCFFFFSVLIWGKGFEEGREELGMRVFLSLKLSLS